ncbi:MAG: DoxX family protein [Gemmatimonadota bacterium]|jgi:putative oxidoreductase
MDKGVNPELGLALLRVVLGVIFISHGAPKLFGGIEGTAGFFGMLGIPLPLIAAWVVALLEFFGGISLLIGLLVTPVSLLLAIHMLAGIVLVHAPNGWYVLGPEANGGVEFSVLLVASLMMLVFGGPGLASIDGRGKTT